MISVEEIDHKQVVNLANRLFKSNSEVNQMEIVETIPSSTRGHRLSKYQESFNQAYEVLITEPVVYPKAVKAEWKLSQVLAFKNQQKVGLWPDVTITLRANVAYLSLKVREEVAA